MPTIISGDNGIDKVASGAVDLSSDVTGILPTANGGTASSSGALPSQTGNSGKYLTTDGTNSSWGTVSGGVTSLNGQTGAITNTDLYAIGSYVIGRPANTTVYAVNSTVAGSSLYSTGASVCRSTIWTTIGENFQLNSNGVTLINTGTWRCVSPTGNSNVTTVAMAGLWVRIS